MREAQIKESFQLVQVNFSGYNRPYEKHGNKYIVTAPGFMLKFDSISEERNENGDLLRIVQSDDVTGAKVESVMQFFDGIPVARMYNTVTNWSTFRVLVTGVLRRNRKREFQSLSARMTRCRWLWFTMDGRRS